MSSFNERLTLTEMVEEKLSDLFLPDEVILKEFGCQSIVGDNDELMNYLKEPEVNQKHASMIVKFAPDFILLKKKKPQELYFVDVKHSTSPVWSEDRLKMLRAKNKDIRLSNDGIGVVAREALLSYRRYYPNTIIIMACPYNPKVLMAQFAKNVKCLFCYSSTEKKGYDCECCPAKQGKFFDIERAKNSVGSQTPMTDVDLNSFEPIEEFFAKLCIKVDEKNLSVMEETIKKETIGFGERVYSDIKNTVLWKLNNAGCSWIDYELYSFRGNDFYHLKKECKHLYNMKERLETYKSRLEATNAGKRTYCRACFPDK